MVMKKKKSINLSVNIGGIKLKNPVITDRAFNTLSVKRYNY